MAFGKFGRYHPDGVDVRLAEVDLVALLRAETDAIAAAHPSRDVHFSADAARFVSKTDALHVRYVAVNLLQNALKYSAPDSKVEVDLRTGPGSAALTVRDRGIGIPNGELEKLFSPFYRASNVGALPGTGMGLAIVKKSASLVGARVDVETAPGEGTAFTVVFPA